MYFSLTTITTVITATTPRSLRSVGCGQRRGAVVGQVYLVTFVAFIVSLGATAWALRAATRPTPTSPQPRRLDQAGRDRGARGPPALGFGTNRREDDRDPARDRDPSAGPAVDFYRFASGGWIDISQSPGFGSWGSFGAAHAQRTRARGPVSSGRRLPRRLQAQNTVTPGRRAWTPRRHRGRRARHPSRRCSGSLTATTHEVARAPAFVIRATASTARCDRCLRRPRGREPLPALDRAAGFGLPDRSKCVLTADGGRPSVRRAVAARPTRA